MTSKIQKYIEKISYDLIKQFVIKNIPFPTIGTIGVYIMVMLNKIKKIFNTSFSSFIEQNVSVILISFFTFTFLVSLIISKKKKEKEKEKKQQECNKQYFYLLNNPSNLPKYNSILLKEWNEFIRKNKPLRLKGEKLLEKWIKFLKETKIANRDARLAFTKEELFYIYLISEYVFTQNELVEGSKKHFNGSKNQIWNNLLFPKLKTENHIQDANRFISEVIHQHTKGSNLNYIDFGSGLLSSLLYLISNKETISVNYLGVDISNKFCELSNSLLNASFTNENLIKEFEKEILNGRNVEINKDILKNKDFNPFHNFLHQISPLFPHKKYVIERNINDRDLQEYLLRKHIGNIDIITANYCLHHIPNPILLQNSILDKTCFKLWGTNVSKWDNLIKSAFTSFLFDKSQKDNFFISLQNYSNATIDKEKMNELLDMYIENDRKTIFDVIDKLLKPNGIFFLSDPDGFSDWNGTQIYAQDWSHAIAHFSNLKNDIELMENSKNSLEFLTAYVQLRDENDSLITIELSRDEIINCTFSNKISKYKDAHLGYIIGFMKK